MSLVLSLSKILLISLPLWQVSNATQAKIDRFNVKRNMLYGRPAEIEKRAASSSASSSVSSSSFYLASSSSWSYVASWQASSTFTSEYHYSSSASASPSPTPASCGKDDCKYFSSKTKPYFIPEWPDVDFDAGEFYGGSTPIDESDTSRELFWIFKPAQNQSVEEVTIWLNGGPGCSSLEGFLQENSPISFMPGQMKPQYNPMHWATLTNMLWVEQPVGTGYSKGKVEAKDEYDLADEFNRFFKNWQKLFGIKNYKIYITGESYAGVYIPYIGSDMLNRKDKEYFDLAGALMYDPCIGDCSWTQQFIPTNQFAINNQVILNLNESTLKEMAETSANCGTDAVITYHKNPSNLQSIIMTKSQYIEKYLQYPPPEHQPSYNKLWDILEKCNSLFSAFSSGVTNKNPCYDVYHITGWCPTPYDPMSDYFNRMDVKKAIHAPLNGRWLQCGGKVFAHGGQETPLSIEKTLPQMIEATNRVMVANGDYDGLIYTNGTLLSIQNMTWGGELGFQERPSKDFEVPLALNYGWPTGPQGVMGKAHYERGLMWVETYQAGHMLPQFQPRAAWRQLQWVLGRIDTLWPKD